MEQILITGSEGFVGKSVCDFLDRIGIKYFTVQRSSQVDLCDIAQVKSLPSSKVILHLAAKTYVPDSFAYPWKYYQNNVLSTLNILEKARIDGSRVIFLSTYVYGTPKYLPIDEKHPSQPMNPYTSSKVICENMCQAYARDFSVPVSVLRPFNIYGPNQASHFFIPTILSQIHQEKIKLQDSKPKRDYIFIDDLIAVIDLLIHDDFIGYNVYNVGSGCSYSVREIVNLILELSSSKTAVEYTEIARKGEVYDCIASIEELNKKYDWKSKISIVEGLKMVIANYENKR